MTSKKVEESFPDTRDSYHKHRKKYDVEINRQHPRATRKGIAEEYSITSDSYSSSDRSDYSSDTERRTRGRRRRRRWTDGGRRHRREYKAASSRSRQSSRSRSRSKCGCSDQESHRGERGSQHSENKIKVTFRDTSDDDVVLKKSTGGTPRGAGPPGPLQQQVTAVVHREAEGQQSNECKEAKPSESSENGYQEVQYQKLDTATEVTDTDVFTEDGKVEKSKVPVDSQKAAKVVAAPAMAAAPVMAADPAPKAKRNVPSDPFGEQPFTVSNLPPEEPAEAPASAREAPKAEQLKASAGHEGISSAVPTAKVDDLKDVAEKQSSHQDFVNRERQLIESQQEAASVTNEKSIKSQQGAASVTNEKSIKKEKVVEETAPQDPDQYPPEETKSGKSSSIEEQNADKPPPLSGLQKTVQDLEKFKAEQLEEHFAKDKGLICVILDDDETIEIKRKKESRTKSEHSTHRTRSASRKKEKNQLKRQRRSRSSFEVLSDEGNNEQFSRLTVHDDSGFEPSPRHGSSTFEGNEAI